ncbi:hypothetical protein PR202_ga26473 [Eleusine coracana subsp. coracana]|uniref:CTLH domain-containing protein n=1 Tax=Eleusine coracana subsp. coracana TaxID=191504 RepID=A0AAV5DDY6_ELECO|nr:hypothetical protein PR202_ga26473 [Eleusine coracana subsp. coracana]
MFLSRIVLRDLDSIDSPTYMASSKKVVTRDVWERKLRDVKIRKEDMNRLVMNFLVTEGYVDAADKFRVESGTQPDIDLATITDRMEVKRAVQSGNVQEAIEKINDLNPTILDTNPQLYFHLQQQKLIELIRAGKINEALEFAQEELAPRGEENQAFLEEIEKTVALLVFEDVKNCPYGELLDVSQRLKTASEVNAAILTSQSHEKAFLRSPPPPQLLPTLQHSSPATAAAPSQPAALLPHRSSFPSPRSSPVAAPSLSFAVAPPLFFSPLHRQLTGAAPPFQIDGRLSHPAQASNAEADWDGLWRQISGLTDYSHPFLFSSTLALAESYFFLYHHFLVIADPKLPSLLKMLIWTQNQLDEKAAYPRINNFSTAALEDPSI